MYQTFTSTKSLELSYKMEVNPILIVCLVAACVGVIASMFQKLKQSHQEHILELVLAFNAQLAQESKLNTKARMESEIVLCVHLREKQNQVKELRNELNLKAENEKALQKDLASIQMERDELLATVSEMNDSAQAHLHQIQELTKKQNQLKQLQNELNVKAGNEKTLRKDLASIKMEKDELLATVSEMNDSAQAHLHQIQELTKKLKEKDEETATLRCTISSLGTPKKIKKGAFTVSLVRSPGSPIGTRHYLDQYREKLSKEEYSPTLLDEYKQKRELNEHIRPAASIAGEHVDRPKSTSELTINVAVMVFLNALNIYYPPPCPISKHQAGAREMFSYTGIQERFIDILQIEADKLNKNCQSPTDYIWVYQPSTYTDIFRDLVSKDDQVREKSRKKYGFDEDQDNWKLFLLWDSRFMRERRGK